MNREELLKTAKPILFNTEMAQATLENRKTVTRRVVKPQPKCYGPSLAYKHDPNLTDVFLSAEKGILRCRRCAHYPEYSNEGSDISHHWKPPYKIGDILYVRETWQCINPYSDKEYVYKASCDEDYASDIGKWLPSIHMPKDAARIFLKVTDVRVERLQDITEEKAEQEGIRGYSKDGKLYKYAVSLDWWDEYHRKYTSKISGGTAWQDMPKNPWVAFMYLWDSTIKKQNLDKYGWAANPWVWVIEFERVEVQQ